MSATYGPGSMSKVPRLAEQSAGAVSGSEWTFFIFKALLRQEKADPVCKTRSEIDAR